MNILKKKLFSLNFMSARLKIINLSQFVCFESQLKTFSFGLKKSQR